MLANQDRNLGKTRIALFAAVVTVFPAIGMANSHDIPQSFQGQWRGTACLMEGAFAQIPSDVIKTLKLRIRQSLLTITPTSFTRPPSTLARMSEGTDVEASPTQRPLKEILRDLNIQVPSVLGKAVLFYPSLILEGVTLTVGACQMGPGTVVVQPGQPRPSGAPVASKNCHPVLLFHYPDVKHVVMPSDGIIGCLEVFERVGDASAE